MKDEAFDILFTLAASRGPSRLELLEPKNTRLAARLRHTNPVLYATLQSKLSSWGENFTMWKADVRKALSDGRTKATKASAEKEAEERLEAAIENGQPVIEVGAPVTIAMDFKAQCRPHLMYADGEWLDYRAGAYHGDEDRAVRAAVQQWLATGVDNKQGNEFQPTRRDLDDIMDALRNSVFRSKTEAAPPSWLDPQDEDPDPRLILSVKNGLVNVLTGDLMDHTPRFFTRNSVPYSYEDPLWTEGPVQWLAFLESLWPDTEGGADVKRALQEIIGHLLTGETKYQKIFMLVGKPRAGKGVIARILKALLGEGNVVSKSADSMGASFGRANLIGKQVMIVNDLRLGKKSNIGGITEFLLNVSGEDDMSIDRKFKDDWSGTLNTRAFLISNAATALPDQSGAMLERLVPIVLHKSFAANPDVTLTDRLLAELPAILNWAIEGLKRLESRTDTRGNPTGFIQTADGKKMLRDISRSASVVRSFLDECCVIGPDASADKKPFFESFEGWCRESDIQSTYMEETFTKELKVASGYVIEPKRITVDGVRLQVYVGVDLRPEFKDYAWEGTDSDF